MACSACNNQNNSIPIDLSKKVNLFKFNTKREQIKDPKLPDSIVNNFNTSTQTAVIGDPTPTPFVKKDLPSIKKMAFSLTEALKENIKQAVSGGAILAPPDILLKRMDLCSTCEFFIVQESRCSKCGCYMNVKARMSVSTCPLNKW